VGFVAYLGFLAVAPRLGRVLVVASIVGGVAVFVAVPPLLSHDVYSYIAYARLGIVHGLDPYIHPPAAAPHDSIFASVTWVDTTSAYGPLFTLATYPLAGLPVDTAVIALKAAAGGAVLLLAALVARLAATRGVNPLRAAAFVALNPLVLVHVIGGAHNDGLTMALAMLGVAAVLAAREATGGATLVAAAAIKFSALVIAPFALLGARDRLRLAAGALLAVVLIAAAADLAFGWDWLHAFSLAGENQGRTSHLSAPTTFARLTGLPDQATRIASLGLYAILVAYLMLRTWRGLDWVRAAAWASFGLLLATSWLLPWYLVWALPLVAISRDRPLQLLTLTLTAYQLGARIPL